MENEVTYTTEQVARITGLTPRQLQWWDEHSHVSPSRRGRGRAYSRRYTQSDIRRLILRKRLGESGFSPQSVTRLRIPLKLIDLRWLLFAIRDRTLIAASNDRREILKAGAACAGPVVLVEMPV